MTTLSRLPVFVAAFFLLGLACSHAKPLDTSSSTLYRDKMEYAPFRLTWTQNPDMKQVRGVFPSPIEPQYAALATEMGLYFTTDAGRTWVPLPEATTAKVGLVNDIAFHPLLPDTFYIGSQTSGVWVTSDQGKTFTQVGSKDKGLASDTVVSLIVYPGDPSHHTLLAVHGDAASGISRSHDSGITWDVVNTDYKFNRLLGGEGEMNEFFLFGSAVKDTDVQGIYSCNAVGEFVLELVHDVVPTDMVYAPGVPIPYEKPGTLYAATSDSGAYHIDDSAFGDTHNVVKLPFKDVDNWASIGATWGPNADVINLFLYDPTKHGLVVSHDDLATSRTASEGLMLSPLVKDGAVIRPNTNGTVFYNVVNGTLAVGRMPAEVPEVEIIPPAIELSATEKKRGKAKLKAAQSDQQVTITARVPIQPVPPTSVTVDLSRAGGTPNTPLYDDGNHNDGAAGDGLYGGTFPFVPESPYVAHQQKDWRGRWPGRMALGVTVTYPDGHHTGAVAVETIFTGIADLKPWLNSWPRGVFTTTEGSVTAESLENPREVHNGSSSLRLNISKGHWIVHIKNPQQTRDITSHEAIAFWIAATNGTPPKEITLQLKDHPEFSDSTTTDSTPVLNGLVPGASEQRVVVPITQLLTSSPHFQIDHLDEIILSGDADSPVTLVLNDLQILAQNDQSAVPASAPAPAAR